MAMVDIKITCKKCKEELQVIDTFATAIVGEIGIKVTPCDCTSRADDCSECEDLKFSKNKLAASEEEVRSLQVKLHNIQMFLDDGPELKQADKPAQPDKFDSHKPAQPNEDSPGKSKNLPTDENKLIEVQRHASVLDEDSKTNILQPTENIVSTGGAIVPGIKKDSAHNTKADYSKGLPA